MSALLQQTDKWLKLRKDKVGASDAPVIMKVSPWKTPYQLWEEKVGITENSFKSRSMQRGLDLEDKARDKFEEMTGLCVFPTVVFHPEHSWMMASLDGMDIGKNHIVEIKCPGKEDHQLAKSGKIPQKYFPQLQHQLEVCGLDMVYYFSFDGEDGVLLELHREDKYIKNMVSKEKEFWECTRSFIPPEMSEKDFQIKSDDMWNEVAHKWLKAQENIKEFENEERELREMLICMSNKKNCAGAGVRVYNVARKGNIDYSKIPELNGVDLEIYRKPAIKCFKILKT